MSVVGPTTGVAILGCGFVADYYVATLVNHPELRLTGIHDRDPARAQRFAECWNVTNVYASLDDLLADPAVELVLNLTNPTSHFETSRRCLMAGKHVYTEKPLAPSFDEAEELVRLADERGLSVSAAPCTLLGEAAQTLWKALREELVGTVRLVYAELDEGLVHRYDFRDWKSPTGLQWPWADEFRTGVVMEHAGYYVSWLAAFFGPVRRVTSFSSVQVPDKARELESERLGADFAVAVLEFDDVVARLTCSLVADQDHTLRVFGDDGVLSCPNGWMLGAPIYFAQRGSPSPGGREIARVGLRRVLARLGLRRARPPGRELPPVRRADFEHPPEPAHEIDFARGPAEQAEAIRAGRSPRLSAQFSLHVTEVVLAMQPTDGTEAHRTIRTSFDPIEPMPWAQGLPGFKDR